MKCWEDIGSLILTRYILETMNPILTILIIPGLDRSLPSVLISGSCGTRLWVCILYTSHVDFPGPCSFLDIMKLFLHI